MKLLFYFFGLLLLFVSSCRQPEANPPNVLFVLMDDLGYGQFALNNDTLTTASFDPFFVSLVDSLEGYSKETALAFSKRAMPTLSSLAKEGIYFSNAYTTSNICAPSRLGIATACMQNRWGVYTNADCEKSGLPKGAHLAEKIKAQGYRTAHIGKWHIGKKNKNLVNDILKANGIDESIKAHQLKLEHPEVFTQIENCGVGGSVIDEQNPLNNGFDYYYGYNCWGSQYYNSTLVWENFKHAGKQQGYNTDVFTNKAMRFMETAIEEGSPFYVQLHYHAVHDSIEPKAPDAYYTHFKSDSYILNNFYAHIYGVDCNIKRVVDLLKSKGQYKNTLIVFTSDNGGMCGGSYNGHKTGSPLPGNAPYSGHKGNYHLGGIRVPLFMHWPNGIQHHYRSNHLVSTMDILPTALSVAGGTPAKGVDGKSLQALFTNPDAPAIHDYLVWSGIHSYKWGYLINKSTKTHKNEQGFAPAACAVVKDNYLMRYVGSREPGVYTDCMDGRGPSLELYNMKDDYAERINLAKDSTKKVQELIQVYQKVAQGFQPPVAWDVDKWKELRGIGDALKK